MGGGDWLVSGWDDHEDDQNDDGEDEKAIDGDDECESQH